MFFALAVFTSRAFGGIADGNMVFYAPCNDNDTNKTVINTKGTNGASVRDTCDIATTGIVGGALTFDGIADVIDSKSTFTSTLQKDCSFACWVRNTGGLSYGVNGYLYGLWCYDDTPPRNKISIYIDNSGRLFYEYRAHGSSFGVDPFTDIIWSDANDMNWKFIVYTLQQINTNTIRGTIYCNGVQVGTHTQTGVMAKYENSYGVGIGTLYFGAANNYGEYGDNRVSNFVGAICKFRILNKALTPAEVYELWKQESGWYYHNSGQRRCWIDGEGLGIDG